MWKGSQKERADVVAQSTQALASESLLTAKMGTKRGYIGRRKDEDLKKSNRTPRSSSQTYEAGDTLPLLQPRIRPWPWGQFDQVDSVWGHQTQTVAGVRI